MLQNKILFLYVPFTTLLYKIHYYKNKTKCKRVIACIYDLS